MIDIKTDEHDVGPCEYKDGHVSWAVVNSKINEDIVIGSDIIVNGKMFTIKDHGPMRRCMCGTCPAQTVLLMLPK